MMRAVKEEVSVFEGRQESAAFKTVDLTDTTHQDQLNLRIFS